MNILSGVFEDERDGTVKTTGTPISLLIENTDQRSKDYAEIKDKFRPGHADYTYQQKYGIRDYRGRGRASARETAARVAAGAVARAVIPNVRPRRPGPDGAAQDRLRATSIGTRSTEIRSSAPTPKRRRAWETYLDGIRKAGNSVGAVIEVVAEGVPPGWGAPIYGKLDAELAAAMMSINAVKGVEIGEGLAAAPDRRPERRRDARRQSRPHFIPITPVASWAASRTATHRGRASP